MLLYIVKRLLIGALTLLVIMAVSYLMLRFAPGDPSRSNLLSESASTAVGDAAKGGFKGNVSVRDQLYLDKPIWVGFGRWLQGVLCQWEWGNSVAVEPGRPVSDLILERLGLTVKLNLAALTLAWLIAIGWGVAAAMHPGSWFDRSSSLFLFALYSLPVMWVALLLQLFFGYGGIWGVLPLKGITVPGGETMSIWHLQLEHVKHFLLPVFCLSYGALAGLSRYARSGMLETLKCDYVNTARAKGLSSGEVIWHHAFRNALLPLITLAGGMLPALISGSVIVEYVFNLPGMGGLSLQALSSRDYPLLMALFAFSGALTLIGLLAADLLCTAAEPRIKLSRRR